MWRGPATTSDLSPDLYCSESLTNIDEDGISWKFVSQTSNVSVENNANKSTNILSTHDADQKRDASNSVSTTTYSNSMKANNSNNFENCISILDDDDYMQLLQSDDNDILDKPVKSLQPSKLFKEGSFTSGLIQEFTTNSKSAKEKYEDHAHANSTVGSTLIKNSNGLRTKSHSNWSQTPSRYGDQEQQVPEMITPMNEENCPDNHNFDILIFKDEGMCDSDSGSELDWDSLTPPVPASPSDQRVPEADFDLDYCCRDRHHPAPSSSAESFLSSSYSSVEHSSPNWYFQAQSAFLNHENVSNSESDQVVPVFKC